MGDIETGTVFSGNILNWNELIMLPRMSVVGRTFTECVLLQYLLEYGNRVVKSGSLSSAADYWIWRRTIKGSVEL